MFKIAALSSNAYCKRGELLEPLVRSTGNQQPSFTCKCIEGSETIPNGSRSEKSARSASHPTFEDDDIVHPLQKCLDPCNQLVAGSNPAAGANEFSYI